MKAVLGTLAAMPGVHLAMLVSQDGVPIVVRGEARQVGGKERVDDAEVLAGLAAGWISDLVRATAPISWSAPRHLVLRASRGSLVAMQAPRALLVVVLGGGIQPAELRLPMEAALARMQRGLKAGAERTGAGNGAGNGDGPRPGGVGGSSGPPPGIFPVRTVAPASGADRIDAAKNGPSEPYGPSGE